MKYNPIFIIAFIFLISCQTENTTYAEIENPAKFRSGEWVSDKDSLSGISVRKEMLAFYENNRFISDSIYQYKIIDSITIVGNQESKIGTYIKRMSATDTLYSKIIDFNDSTLTLNKRNGIEIFKIK